MSKRLSPVAREAVMVLGEMIRAARLRRKWSVAALAERVGVSSPTITKIERGDASVAIGTVFEAARILDIPLFEGRQDLAARMVRDELALLPARGRGSAEVVPNDF